MHIVPMSEQSLQGVFRRLVGYFRDIIWTARQRGNNSYQKISFRRIYRWKRGYDTDRVYARAITFCT